MSESIENDDNDRKLSPEEKAGVDNIEGSDDSSDFHNDSRFLLKSSAKDEILNSPEKIAIGIPEEDKSQRNVNSENLNISPQVALEEKTPPGARNSECHGGFSDEESSSHKAMQSNRISSLDAADEVYINKLVENLESSRTCAKGTGLTASHILRLTSASFQTEGSGKSFSSHILTKATRQSTLETTEEEKNNNIDGKSGLTASHILQLTTTKQQVDESQKTFNSFDEDENHCIVFDRRKIDDTGGYRDGNTQDMMPSPSRSKPQQLMGMPLPSPKEASYRSFASRTKTESTSLASAVTSSSVTEVSGDLADRGTTSQLPPSDGILDRQTIPPAPTGVRRVQSSPFRAETAADRQVAQPPSTLNRAITMAGAIRVRGIDYINSEDDKSGWDSASERQGEISGAFSSEDFSEKSMRSIGSNGELADLSRPISAQVVADTEQRLQERVDALERSMRENLTLTPWTLPNGRLPAISSAVVSATTVCSIDEESIGGNENNTVEDEKTGKYPFWTCSLGVCILFSLLAGLIGGLAATAQKREANLSPNLQPSISPVLSPSIAPSQVPQNDNAGLLQPTLDRIRERGYIICRAESFERKRGYGLSLDLCRALSAAIFDGDWNRTEFPSVDWPDHWSQIRDGILDISTSQATSNMERDVFQPDAGVGMTFSKPYLYEGSIFAGRPDLVDCAEAGETLVGICSGLNVCVIGGTTTESVVRKHLDGSSFTVVVDSQVLLSSFVSGECNVVVGDRSLIFEGRVREAGYDGEYVFGTRLFSKEPLAMVTNQIDPKFSDFVDWILNAIVTAEFLNITQARAHEFATTKVFGSQYERMFQHAIAAVGNYGEMYERHIEERLPRSKMNSIDMNNAGQLYPHPFGNLNMDVTSNGNFLDGTLKSIEEKNLIICGVLIDRPWLGIYSDSFSGLDVEFCRALSAAVFDGISNRVAIIQFDSVGEAFAALADGLIDVYASAQYTMENDVYEPTTGMGFTLTCPYFYDPETNDAYSLATRETDPHWSDYVQWVLWSTMIAEEEGISSDNASSLPSVELFGENFIQMFRFVNLAVGNYGDIYERTAEERVPRTGRNRLNTGGPKFIPWSIGP